MNTEKVIAQAKSWLGCNEADGSYRQIIDAYNAIGNGIPMDYTWPWCACFVSAVYFKALGEKRFAEISCDRQINILKQLGVYSLSGKPDVGDLVYYDWNSDGATDHVGIVAEINGNAWTIIEGNKSDAVSYRTITPSYVYIKGFGFVTRLDGERPQSSTIGQQMAQQVINGRYTPDTEAIKENMLVPVLELYLQGKSVEAMQSLLILRKIDIGPDGADGYFGSKTYKGLCEFQTSLGRVSGKCDAYTWDKLIKGADKNDSADN